MNQKDLASLALRIFGFALIVLGIVYLLPMAVYLIRVVTPEDQELSASYYRSMMPMLIQMGLQPLLRIALGCFIFRKHQWLTDIILPKQDEVEGLAEQKNPGDSLKAAPDLHVM